MSDERSLSGASNPSLGLAPDLHQETRGVARVVEGLKSSATDAGRLLRVSRLASTRRCVEQTVVGERVRHRIERHGRRRWRRLSRQGRLARSPRDRRRWQRRKRGSIPDVGDLVVEVRTTRHAERVAARLGDLLERDLGERGLARWHGERLRLKRCALRDDQVRVDVHPRLAPEVLRNHSLKQWNSRRAANQNDVVQLRGTQACCLHRVFTDVEGSGNEGLTHVLELLTRQRVVQVERRASIAVGQLLDAELNIGLVRKLDLRPLCSRPEPFVGLDVLPHIVAMRLEEALDHVVCDRRVDVIATEERVAGRCEHFEHVSSQLQDRDVERASTEIIDGDPLGRGLVVAVCERRCGRLVDDAKHVETGHPSSCFGGASLELVEVGGHGDDRLAALFAQRLLGYLSNMSEDERADLAERVRLAARCDQHTSARAFRELERKPLLRVFDLIAAEGTTDQPLDGVDGVLCIEQAPLLRGGAHQHVATWMK